MADITDCEEAEKECIIKDTPHVYGNSGTKNQNNCMEIDGEREKDINSNDDYKTKESDTHIDNQESNELDEKKNNLTKSSHLRFGIEAILKVKAEVTDKLRDKIANSDSIYTHSELVPNDKTQIDHNEIDDDISVDSDEDGIDHVDENDDIRDTCLSHVPLPASFQALRADDNSYFTSQNLFTSGRINLDLPWSPAILNDLRKDRFGPIRRIGHPYQNRTPPKRKKPRTSFTRLQILELEKRFERQKYLASSERSSLAKTLKMSDAQVKTWFQNRRTKWRRQTAEERELERQAANRLLLSFQSDPVHRKSMIISTDRMCLSQLQRFEEERSTDI